MNTHGALGQMWDMDDASDTDKPIPSSSIYDDIVELSMEVNRTTESVIAMDGSSDPWLAGRPERLATAKWFTDLYRRLGLPKTPSRRTPRNQIAIL